MDGISPLLFPQLGLERTQHAKSRDVPSRRQEDEGAPDGVLGALSVHGCKKGRSPEASGP
ncbi:hypothetical protein HMPREF0185_02483 [Brevundimonas diminuta 470-4]|nr:hypothetical protein HMPREF0185_02483 [Brevundimonas diminuta 470-4]